MINITSVVANYKDFLKDRARLNALLLDLYPTDIRDRNIIMSIFDIGIVKRIQEADQISHSQLLIYTKIVEDAYGTNHDLVLEGITTWINALGIPLEKEIECQEMQIKKKEKVRELIGLLELCKSVWANNTAVSDERKRNFYEWLETATSHSWMQKIKESQPSFEIMARRASKLTGSFFDITDPDKIDELIDWIKKTTFTVDSVAHHGLLLRYKQFLKTAPCSNKIENSRETKCSQKDDSVKSLYYDPLIDSVMEAGFDYIDTRYDNSDSLNWLVVKANSRYKPFFDEWKKKGVAFVYTDGTPSSGNQPAWWTQVLTRKERQENENSQNVKTSIWEKRITVGIYKFGVDIPMNVYIKADKHDSNVFFHWGVVNSPMSIKTDRTFTDQLYLCGHEDQYLVLRASDNENYSFTIRQG